MIIEGTDFKLTLLKDSYGIFDLELLKTINKGKETERQEFKNVAYGISLERAIQYIVHARLSERYPDIVDMKSYLSDYKIIIDEIKQLCES